MNDPDEYDDPSDLTDDEEEELYLELFDPEEDDEHDVSDYVTIVPTP